MFFNWRDDPSPKYTKTMIFTEERLYTIRPEQIVQYMQFKVYGKADLDVNDLPTQGRSSSFEFAKKALSHFMPDKLQSWSVRRKDGNPTQSVAVNDFVKLVKKKEVPHQGKKSQARSPFTEKEYKFFMAQLECHSDLAKRFFGASIIKYQYIMGARIDDSSKALSCNLKANSNTFMNHFSLLTQLCWSKNVREERNAPIQILIGAAHTIYCVLLGLAKFLEYHLAAGSDAGTQFLFGTDGLNDAKKINDQSRTLVNGIINAESFNELMDCIKESKGLHSIQKIAATRAKKNGCFKDEIDHQFR